MSHPWALGREQPTPNSAMPRTSSKEELRTTSRFNRMRHGISLRKRRGVPFSSRHQDPAVLLLTRVRALSADHDGEHMLPVYRRLQVTLPDAPLVSNALPALWNNAAGSATVY